MQSACPVTQFPRYRSSRAAGRRRNTSLYRTLVSSYCICWIVSAFILQLQERAGRVVAAPGRSSAVLCEVTGVVAFPADARANVVSGLAGIFFKRPSGRAQLYRREPLEDARDMPVKSASVASARQRWRRLRRAPGPSFARLREVVPALSNIARAAKACRRRGQSNIDCLCVHPVYARPYTWLKDYKIAVRAPPA